ncbi:flagellar basal body P-ring formation chaperone FlgA [Chelativorans sp. YIM 93263]|uniref:flagellar basal body P-ring formation chaperone FlgA n=1 Tax=Chelativorans sp. YIM 93263 TaxID=2906648 RepID=UPI0023782611|nr:flagellar basal body P-ring formation chaperone FlgA [Chelativorans sp. YIM 93263]
MKRLLPRRAILTGLVAGLTFLAAPAQADERVVVPTQVIYPGETIYAGALKEMILNRRKRHTPDLARSPQQLDGKVARRTLLPGRMISLSSIREPHLVERGTEVTAVFSDNGLIISTRAVPQQSAGAGDMVKLRNMDSGTTFSGIVMQDGTVRVSAR